jgi:hypothetical protein
MKVRDVLALAGYDHDAGLCVRPKVSGAVDLAIFAAGAVNVVYLEGVPGLSRPHSRAGAARQAILGVRAAMRRRERQ